METLQSVSPRAGGSKAGGISPDELAMKLAD